MPQGGPVIAARRPDHIIDARSFCFAAHVSADFCRLYRRLADRHQTLPQVHCLLTFIKLHQAFGDPPPKNVAARCGEINFI